MHRLSEKLRQPGADREGEAKRLDAAGQLLSTENVEDVLGEVLGSIQRNELLEAVLKQDRAIESLDRIIEVLEERRFDDQAVEDKLKQIRDARATARELAKKQKDLLSRTKDALSDRELQKTLSKLSDDLEKLESQQKQALDGKSAESIDPSLQKKDQDALTQASDAAA